jgi:hypothetical protein
MLFPWLYPGVNGYFNEIRSIGITVKGWAIQQLYMADGWFSWDNTWCLYALNYAECRRNQVQGQWFVNNLLYSEEIPDIDTLRSKLRNNDTKLIQKQQYFARCVPGSDLYWRNKRTELVSWIGHNVEERNGAPSLFVALPCA